MKFLGLFFCFILISCPSFSQSININLGNTEGTAAGHIIQLILLLTVLSVAPSIVIMMTSFTRIIIVLSLLRSALGTATTPPNMVLASLALFLTGFIMAPTLEKSWETGISPIINEQVAPMDGLKIAAEPLKEFMVKNTRDKDLELFYSISNTKPEEEAKNAKLSLVVPAFMISELRRAFEIGFLIFIPFLIIDMVVSSILMSMGMMMIPPVMIALPFKIIFFVLIDGWYMLVGSLIKGFSG